MSEKRSWWALHPEMTREVLTHDYFTCPLCKDSWMVEWVDGVVSCHQCNDHVMISSEPRQCPVCGKDECVRRVEEDRVLLSGGLPCGHDPEEERAEIDDDMGMEIWCAECENWWFKPEEII